MKKSLLSIAFVFCVYVLSAQIEQGSFLLSGGLNYSTSTHKFEMKSGSTTNTQDGPKITDMGIGVGGAYFFTDKLAAGMGLGFNSWKETEENLEDPDVEYEQSDKVFLVEPFLRYYAPMNDDFSFFGEFAAAFGFGKEIYEVMNGSTTQTEEMDLNLMRIGITPGFNYMMSDKVGFEINYGFLGYHSYTAKSKEGDTESKDTHSGFGLNVDFSSLQFAIVFIL